VPIEVSASEWRPGPAAVAGRRASISPLALDIQTLAIAGVFNLAIIISADTDFRALPA
jgi:hypothetical protein